MDLDLPQRPVSVAVLFLQPRCNMTCSFCVTEDDFDAFEPAAARELLARLAQRGVETVTFGGGEPFAWPGGVMALAREAKRLGLRVQVGTNGVALPRGFERATEIDRWVLPLESTDPAVHDGLRRHGSGGHHALVLRRLEALGRAGRSATVSTVVTRPNAAGLGDLARWLGEHHARHGHLHAWHLYRFLPLGRGGRAHAAELEIPLDEYERRCDEVRELDLPFRLFRRRDMYRSRVVEFFWMKDGRVTWGSESLWADSTDAA